jgi:hypothetical protein
MAAQRSVKASPKARKVSVLRGNPDGGPFHDGDFCEAFATKKEAVARARGLGHNVSRPKGLPSMGVIPLPDAGRTIICSPAARKAFPDAEEWLREIGRVAAELDSDIDLGGFDLVAGWTAAMCAEDSTRACSVLCSKPACRQVFCCSEPVAAWSAVMSAEDLPSAAPARSTRSTRRIPSRWSGSHISHARGTV